MSLSDERIQQMKDILEKKGKREYSWTEASKVAHNLQNIVVLLLDQYTKEKEGELKGN